MRLAGLLLLLLTAQSLFGQKIIALTGPVDVPGVRKPVLAQNYNLQTAEKKLTRSKRLFISGITLTSAFGAAEATGITIIVEASRKHNETLASAGTWLADDGCFVLLVTGITTLSVGVHMRNRWTKIKADLPAHVGLLSNGHMGLTLNF